MTDVEFFRKKAEEAGFDITCEKDKRIIEGLGYALYDALHFAAGTCPEDFLDARDYHLYITENAIMFDNEIYEADISFRMAYLFNMFGFKLYNDSESDCYKIFIRK